MNSAPARVRQLVAASVAFFAASLTIASAGMLKNIGFETASTLGEASAQNWKMNDPDEHGDCWGSAAREDWRAHEGTFEATIRGTWAAVGDFGGWWQEAAATPGTSYRVSVWLWADVGWSPAIQELKIEFWNTDRSQMLGSAKTPIIGIGETWTEVTVDGVAPENSAWVRAVVNVSGANDSGALQIDELDVDKAL